MQLLNNVTTSDALDPAQWNEIATELQNAATRAGLTLSGADLEQLVKATVDMSCANDWYNDVGVADAYVLQAPGGRQGLSQLVAATDGATVRFRPSNANTGASTVAVAGLASKAIRNQAGAALSGGELVTSQDIKLRYNQATDQFFLAPGQVIPASSPSVASSVSVSIPADLPLNSSGADNLWFLWDYSARIETEDWFGGVTIDTINLVVPAGINRITVEMQINWSGSTATDVSTARMRLFRNGLATGWGVSGNAEVRATCHGPIQSNVMVQHRTFDNLAVSPADTIRMEHRHDTGGNQAIGMAHTYINVFGFTG